MLTLFRKLLELFTRRERRNLLVLLAAALATALLQTFAVASIMPFMALVADPAVVFESQWLAWLYGASGVADLTSFQILLGVVVLGLLVLSNAFAGLTSWGLMTFAFRKNHDLSTMLLSKYLSQPYTAFLDRNTAELSKNILGEVLVVVTGVLIPGMYVLVRGTTALFIMLLLVYVDVRLAVSVFVALGGAYAIIYYFVRGRQARYGAERLEANSERFRMAAEALGGVKEIQVLEREAEFVARFAQPSSAFATNTVRNEVVGLLPRYAMETIAFGGILLIVVSLLARGQDLGQIIPPLSLYAFGGYKLLPALQQLFEGLTTVRFYEPALDTLRDDLLRDGSPVAPRAAAETPASEPADVEFEQGIRLAGVSFTYPGAPGPSLEAVDLTIARGTTHGLVGGTGSGKTTLVDLILGLLVPENGALEVDGRRVTGPLVSGWRRHVGYVPQEIFLTDDTVANNIAFGVPREQVDRERVEWASGIAQLDEVIAELPEGLETVIGERGVRLSGGQQQRIGIARALYRNPDVLILDEGTSALDGVTEAKVTEALRALEPRKTMIWIAHRLVSLRDCDQIHVLDQGKIVTSGRYDQLMETSELFRAMASAAPADEVLQT